MAPAPGAGVEGTEERAAAADRAVDELECNLCTDTVYSPTTLQCCGKTFCRRCLQKWLRKSVEQAGVPRCPAGCGSKLPFKLPARNQMLQRVVEAVAAQELERRKEEDAEYAAEEPEVPGEFFAWQEVAAKTTLSAGAKHIVKAFTSGIVVGPARSEGRVTVKFEWREDGSELCVDVMPSEIMLQLPQHLSFRVGDTVAAAHDLRNGDRLLVSFGAKGRLVGTAQINDALRLVVQFEERCDGAAGALSVLPCEVVAPGPYIGGFSVAQRVHAARDLVSGNTLLAREGAGGVVLGPYSDIRVTVRFDERADGANMAVNVTSDEIRSA